MVPVGISPRLQAHGWVVMSESYEEGGPGASLAALARNGTTGLVVPRGELEHRRTRLLLQPGDPTLRD